VFRVWSEWRYAKMMSRLGQFGSSTKTRADLLILSRCRRGG